MSNKNINALSHDKPTIATERPSPKIKSSGSGSKGKKDLTLLLHGR